MGVDIIQYRVRIGAFVATMSKRKHRVYKEKAYCRYVKGPNIHWRMFSTCIMLLCILGSYRLLLTVASNIQDKFLVSDMNMNMNTSTVCTVCNKQINNYQFLEKNDEKTLSYGTFTTYFEQRLLQSCDVELNPGPLADAAGDAAGVDKILEAIKCSESRLLNQIQSVKSDISYLKTEMIGVKEECLSAARDIKVIKGKQAHIEGTLTTINEEIYSINDKQENTRLDVEHLDNELQRKCLEIDQLKLDLDRLEQYCKRSSMRIFGLQPLEHENPDTIKEQIVNDVLKVACPDELWDQSAIK